MDYPSAALVAVVCTKSTVFCLVDTEPGPSASKNSRNNDGISTDGETFEGDRTYLENVIKEKEKEIVQQQQQSSSTGRESDLLSGSGERLVFQSAFHSKGIHERFVKVHCQRTEDNLEAAKSQLDVLCSPVSSVGRNVEDGECQGCFRLGPLTNNTV